MKRIILISLTSLISIHVFSQKINYEIKAGANYMCPYFKTNDAKIGYQFGLGAEFKIYKPFSLNAELLLAKKKYEKRYKTSWEQKTEASYIDIPVYLSYKLFESFSLYAGGETGLRIKHQTVNNEENDLIRDSFPPDKQAYGLLVGFKLEPLKRCGMDLRYSVAFERSNGVQNFRGWQFFITYKL